MTATHMVGSYHETLRESTKRRMRTRTRKRREREREREREEKRIERWRSL